MSADTLEFGFDNTRMYVDVPYDVLQKAMAKSRVFSRMINLTYPEYSVIQPMRVTEGATRLVLQTRKAGSMDDGHRMAKIKQMVEAIETITTFTHDGREDPNLSVNMGLSLMGSSDRYGMAADVRWPDTDEADLQTFVTKKMLRTAADLQYSPNYKRSKIVGANINRQHGVSIIAHSIGSSTLDTDGDDYQPEEPVIELYAHNLYGHDMQLICLSGLIAIAQQGRSQIEESSPLELEREVTFGELSSVS